MMETQPLITLGELPRCRRIIETAIRDMKVDLCGAVVLTEAASGYYALTPLLAALANADHVYALGRDSAFGPIKSIADGIQEIASMWNIADKITIVEQRNDKRLASVDIVTNLGFVRPIDDYLLSKVSKDVSVALMWEAWEYRPEDIDLLACRQRGVPVVATDEHHPVLNILEYVGMVAIKILLQNNIEVFGCRIAVAGDGVFADIVSAHLRKNGCVVIEIPDNKFTCPSLSNIDALILANHTNREIILGGETGINVKDLYSNNPDVVCIHISGGVDTEEVINTGLKIIPAQPKPAGYMSFTTDFVGPRPLIYLHAAGLAIGYAMRSAAKRNLRGYEAEMFALHHCEFAQRLNI